MRCLVRCRGCPLALEFSGQGRGFSWFRDGAQELFESLKLGSEFCVTAHFSEERDVGFIGFSEGSGTLKLLRTTGLESCRLQTLEGALFLSPGQRKPVLVQSHRHPAALPVGGCGRL